MRLFPVRSVAVLALVIAPAVASAQGTTPPPGGPPPAGGAAATGGAGAGSATPPRAQSSEDSKATPPADAKSTGNIGGVSFNDKPRRQTTTARIPIRHVGGPLATFPGFEQLPDGGSRFFVHVSQNVAVEERKAQGSVSYVLRGAHLRVHNDSNALVTVHFNTPVFRARLTQQGNDLLFVLELRSAATPTFKIGESTDKTATLQVDFAKGDFLGPNETRNETIPAEVRTPSRSGGRGKGTRGAQGRPAQQQQPADDNGNGDSGPNP